MSSIRYTGSGHHFCGGSIIDQWHILTAAHCLHYPNSNDPRPVESLKIVLGDHVTTSVQPSEKVYSPQRFLIHEDYNRTIGLDNDIALIELTTAIEYNKVIAPVCLPTSPPTVEEMCITTGWGRGTGDPALLKELHIPIISNEDCNSPDYYNGSITPNMVCAGYKKHSVCQGDSGGPLVCNTNGNSPYSLVGVTSWSPLQCRNLHGNKPSGFVNVYNYVEWISRMSNHSGRV